jgi:hypothetical protein
MRGENFLLTAMKQTRIKRAFTTVTVHVCTGLDSETCRYAKVSPGGAAMKVCDEHA